MYECERPWHFLWMLPKCNLMEDEKKEGGLFLHYYVL